MDISVLFYNLAEIIYLLIYNNEEEMITFLR